MSVNRFCCLMLALVGWVPNLARGQDQAVLIGQSAGLTGGQARYSQHVKAGIEAALNAFNSRGGLRGRPLKLITLDDAGRKEKVAANTRELVEQHRVVALVGYTSGAGVEDTLPYLNAADVPMIGPVTGNMGIRARFQRQLFHTRAGYADEMRRLVDYQVTTGLRRFAIAYLDDVGPANPQAMLSALSKHQLTPVASVGLNRNAENFDREIELLLAARPDAVLFISNAKPITHIVRGMRQRGYGGQFASSSFSGIGVIQDLQQFAPGLILSQVLPAPGAFDLKLTHEYGADLRTLSSEHTPNYTSLEGYLAARVLIQGLKGVRGPLTASNLITALESLGRFKVGGYELNFTTTSHDGSRYVNTGVVSRDQVLRF